MTVGRCMWPVAAVCALLAVGTGIYAQDPPNRRRPENQPDTRPWMDSKVAPEKRAEMVLKELTLDEKISLLHGQGSRPRNDKSIEGLTVRALNNGDVGFVMGVERLGIPPIQMQDAAYGVRMSARNGRYSTALPSNLGSAASWDTEAACAYGTLIGSELRSQGFNMTLGGGSNLTREPRNGRTFEYMGEDPLLTGIMVGNRIRCEGEQHVINDIKHYALNDQESGRTNVDVHIGERAMRETDLMAFEIGIRTGHPKAVMCSYNGVNGDYACENKYLLNDVLKRQWKFPGFVVSDWGGTHSTEKASAAGLDQEQPDAKFYGDALKAAVDAGRVPMAELDEHVRRVLYAEFASGIVDFPQRRNVVDVLGGLAVARRIEEGSAVLLRNQGSLLPLDSKAIHKLAVIGQHADTGMISGGGSAQVDPPGETAGERWRAHVWFPTSPLKAVQAKLPGAEVTFSSGENVADAVKAAKTADVAVVFVTQWESEDFDLPTLALEEGQAELIAAVAKANPHTVVVLESGSAVTMPWLNETGAVLEAWFPGSDGANAVANLLFGDVNPSGKLPMTFPASDADVPHPNLLKPPAGSKNGVLSFKVDYDEGLKVGYRWYDSEHKQVLFPFGFGLSYTSFRYSDFKVAKDGSEVTLTVTNTGKVRGAEVAEVYASVPASGEPPKRLIGWQKTQLAPGESKTLKIAVDPMYLSVWDEVTHKWVRPAGQYKVMAGGSSADLPLSATIALK
ncbi:MAG TPA: glycoside hydrolase family 3 C-terminal domain-containing protein [Acidobacteriaceae bacterium]